MGSNHAARAWGLCACAGALALVACFRTAQPVHFFASGRPAKLSDWQVVYTDGGDSRAQRRRCSLRPEHAAVQRLCAQTAHRWLPRGTSAKYNADGSFDFPVGTIISKTFYYPLPQGAARDSTAVARTYDQSRDFSDSGRGERGLKLANVHLIETRILVRREAGWEALPYVWNSSQTDAMLARTGDTKPLELVSDDGSKEAFTYVVPNENQCAGCHVADLKTKQIAPSVPRRGI